MKLGHDVVVTLLATELHSRAVDLLDRTALAGERVDRHECRAHRGLREAEIIRARDLERLAKRVKGLRGIAAARPYVHQSTLRPAERDDVCALLLKFLLHVVQFFH